MKNKNIAILQHNISYYYNNGQNMPYCEQEHVSNMIIDGYNCGELNDETDDYQTSGWWEIED